MLLELENRLSSVEPSRPREEFELGKTVDAVRLFVYRRHKIIIVVAACVIVASIAYLKVVHPSFTAGATINIVNREGGFLQQQATVAAAPIDLQEEISLAKSSAVAERVVKKLRLDEDPEFNRDGDSLISKLRALWTRPAISTEFSRLRSVIVAVQGRTRVTAIGAGSAFKIGFTSSEGIKSADVANALAEAFIELQNDADDDIHRKANDWLINQSNELRKRAADADSAVAEFEKANNLVTVDGKLLDQQKLQDVNNRISAAKEKMIAAQYKMEKISDIVEHMKTRDILEVTSAPEILSDPTIAESRQRYVSLSSQVDALQKDFGKHSQKLRDMIDGTKVDIFTELPRLQESARNDYQLASKFYLELLAEEKTATEASERANYLEVQLRELQGTAENYKNLYANFLQHAAGSIQEVSFPVRAAQISERATPPLEKSWPKTGIVLALACVGGLGLGATAGMMRDFSDRTYRTGAEFESATRLKCIGLIPRTQISKTVLRKASLPAEVQATLAGLRRIPLWWKIKASPNSRFVSELISVSLTLRNYANTCNARVIGVTSALPGEGKSTLTVALGVLMAQSGHRVAIVDLDFRIRALTEAFAPPGRLGLSGVLSGLCSLGDVMFQDPHLALTFVPGGSTSEVLRPLEMLTSAKLKECIARLRQSYDYVLIDLPPLVPVADVRATSELIEGYILTVEWAETNRALVVRALDSYEEIRNRFIGGILNKINFKSLSKYDSIAPQYYMKADFERYRDRD